MESEPAHIVKVSTRKLEEQIEAHEKRIKEIDLEMLDPKVYADGLRMKELQEERAKVVGELTPLEAEWLRRACSD